MPTGTTEYPTRADSLWIEAATYIAQSVRTGRDEPNMDPDYARGWRIHQAEFADEFRSEFGVDLYEWRDLCGDVGRIVRPDKKIGI